MESEAVQNLKIIEAKIQQLLSELHEISAKDILLADAKGAENLERSIRSITSTS